MSFLKITDPAKRDFIVADFLKTKKNIQQNFLSERLGDSGLQQELTKLYKPIVDSQSAISKEQNVLLSAIKENSVATSNALQTIQTRVQFPQYPSIEAYSDDPVENIITLDIGDVATKYLHQYASYKKNRRHNVRDKLKKWAILHR
jgi:CRISPR/Cas system CSM-associated protein Csm4 (group 5 of RAMP superfamily)